MLNSLKKLIDESDERTRQWHSNVAAGPVLAYSLLLSLFKSLRKKLEEEYSFTHLAYFPTRAEQIGCIKTLDKNGDVEPITREFDQVLQTIAHDLVSKFPVSQKHITFNHDNVSPDNQILRAILRVFPELSIENIYYYCFYLTTPSELTSIERRIAQELEGLLLVITNKTLDDKELDRAFHLINNDFSKFLRQVLKYSWFDKSAVIGLALSHEREIDKLTQILQQEAEIKGIGLAASSLVHRFVNIRANAQLLCDLLPTAENVKQNPEIYEQNIKALRAQLVRARRLEHPLQGVISQLKNPKYSTSSFALTSCSVYELVNLFVDCFEDQIKYEQSLGYSGKITLDINPSLNDISANLSSTRVKFHELCREVFFIHLDNSIREIKLERTKEKTLFLQIENLGDFIAIGIINLGEPIPPEVKRDIDNIVRVRRPYGAGLGVFLSSIIMQDFMFGKVIFISPYKNEIGTKVNLLFRKESS